MIDLAIQPHPPTAAAWDWQFWRRWVAANALAELIGLGGSLLIGLALFALLGEGSIGAVIGLVIAAILLGALVEGVLVGWFQWRVLRDALPGLPRGAWVKATALGAGIAWTLGMLPSTILSLGADAIVAESSPPPEPSTAVVLLLAAGMGLALGAALAAPQWIVLRRFVRRAGGWIPANMLAWALGMALIFAGTGCIPNGTLPAWVIAVLLGVVLLAGISVGAVHGLWLVKTLRQPSPRAEDIILP